MQFSEIPGLKEVKAQLIKSVKDNHVAHALLFDGKMGGAALPMAMAFATYINCESPNETDSCGICSNCSKINKLAHPDLNFVFPTAGGKKVLSENFINEFRKIFFEKPFFSFSDWLEKIEIKQGNIPVEESRQIIQNLSLKSYEGGYKMVLVWNVESMAGPAANALLKILEEPPAKTIFLLVSYHYQVLLPTIISRTQRVGIRDFNNQEIIDYLLKTQSLDAEKASKIAFLADGNINDAIKLSTEASTSVSEWFAAWMRVTYAFDIEKLVHYAEEFDGFTKEIQKNYLEFSLKMFRELFLQAINNPNLLKSEGDQLIFVQKFSKALKFQNIEKIMSSISEAQYMIERNVRAKIMFLDLSMNLAKLVR